MSKVSHKKQLAGREVVKCEPNGISVLVPHSRGSIVRLKLHNFLTFDGVEIRPSSQLNVIVGPNGTGKSSVVCAICIGLGGATKLLGRAKEIKEFVKHGKREGYVELELCETRRGTRNPVIKRQISADTNSSTWFINGTACKQADVTKLVENMNIQLQNKCVFLPQDMVVEFARMNIHQRLQETEKAVGPKGMFAAHTELKNLRLTYSSAETDLSAQRNTLSSEERKNQLLERDVERYNNRQLYMDRIKWIGLKKLWLEYEAVRNDLNVKRDKRKEAAGRVKELRRTYQPIKEKHKAQEDALKVFKQTEAEANQKRRQLVKTVSSLQDKMAALVDKLDEPKQELEQAKKDEAERRGKVEKLRREVEGTKQELDALESHESIGPKIRAKNDKLRSLNQEMENIGLQLRDFADEREKCSNIIRNNEEELRRIQDVRSQRVKLLQRLDHWAHDALRWLEKNQHMFKKPILEPMMVCVNILDPKYTKQVESFLGGRDFVSFVAQTEEDRELFLREVRDKMKLKVNVVMAPNNPLSYFNPKIPISDLRRYGFDKMMIELIEAPEPLLSYFCQYQQLQSVPVAARSIPPEKIQKITDHLPDLRQFFVGDSRYSVIRSRYRNATSTRVGEVRNPIYLTANMDSSRKAALEQEIQEQKRRRSELDQSYEALQKQYDDLRSHAAKVLNEKNAFKKITDQRRSLTGILRSRETRLETLTSMTFNLQEAEEKCQKALDKIQGDRVKQFSRLSSVLKESVQATIECVKASLRVKTCEMRVGYLMQQYHDIKDTFERAEREMKNLEDAERQAKEKAQIMLKRARDKSGVNSPADNDQLMTHFRGLPNEMEELLELMHSLQAQADMCEGIDPEVVREFKERKRRIQSLKQKIEEKERQLQNKDERIAQLKEQWLGPLKKLVSGISDRFRHFFSNHTQMDAAGEVCLVESGDFSKYGIEIKVKFRDNEQLQALNAQRQSGGERSVSTMLYLMALQGGSSCPFRVVDEINQGMDPVNERHVFNLIVKSATEGAQYFLLTPKLLQNLEYSEAVQVHVVNNGQETMDFSEYNLEKILS